ncbi:MAG: integrase core domain-containing protein [Bifidobacterium breve]
MRRAPIWPPARPYVRVGGSWAYVCLPGGLADRQIAGHSVGVRHDADLVLAAFAALCFPLDEIGVFRTDRGGGFTGERIERILDVFGITRSLSRPGSPYDDAVVESTNRLVKKELIYNNVCTNVEQLRSDVNRYVWWYNHQRLHSTLGYLSPVEFTQQGNTL